MTNLSVRETNLPRRRVLRAAVAAAVVVCTVVACSPVSNSEGGDPSGGDQSAGQDSFGTPADPAAVKQGGELVTGHEVTDLREFEGVPAVLLDTTPRAFVRMAGDRVHDGYRRWVSRYKHGPGVFKIDWVLSEPVPAVVGTAISGLSRPFGALARPIGWLR